MTGALAIRAAFAALNDALTAAGVPYAFIGAMPVLVWGRVRTTTDLDAVVLVTVPQWPRVTAELATAGFAAAPSPGIADQAAPLRRRALRKLSTASRQQR